jgi:ParB family chromosome partitioning protein
MAKTPPCEDAAGRDAEGRRHDRRPAHRRAASGARRHADRGRHPVRLLILAFGGDNVTVDSGSDLRGDDRQAICRALTEGGVLTADRDLLRQAARKMLTGVLSCRENRSQSGPFARIAGEAIGASLRLPNMATEEFLSCLSRGALETVARAEGVNIAPRAKDTRARMVTRFKDGTFVYPGALFRLTPEEQAAARTARHARSGRLGQSGDRRGG